MSKSAKAKWFVVAVEGATTDGRAIQRNWIEQMAKHYNSKTYSARINLEHLKWRYFDQSDAHSYSYGDVLALKTEEREDGKLQLLAQIDPTDKLIALNKERQKIYTSVEIDTNFADIGEAYLVGLAVTDNPASLGTEMLVFSSQAKQNPLADRKQKPENLFTAAVETHFEFIEPSESLLDKIKAIFSQKAEKQDEKFADVEKAMVEMAQTVAAQAETISKLSAENQNQATSIADLQKQTAEFGEKFAKLEQQPKPKQATPFSQHAGGDGSGNQLADY